MEIAISRVDKPFTDYQVTPYFRYDTVEDVAASFREKRPVMRTIELCEMRIAGDKNFMPVVPADSIWRQENGRAITYAERFADQYRAFKLGNGQNADGTPLEELAPYGITPANLSLCRTMQITSIEGLHALEGKGLKALGVMANDLKRMAASWMADQARGGEVVSELDALRRRVAELEASEKAAEAVAEDALEDVIEASAFAAMDERQLKAYIKERTGQTPLGNPSRETLLRMAEEA